MKKMYLTLALVVSMISVVNAQVEGKAIGLRFGNGGEISFQTALGEANRLELDLGLNNWDNNYGYSGFGLTGIYQWVWGLDEIAPGFKWYAGFGATVGSYKPNGIGVGLAGQIGLEYNFTIPLQISIDYRPAIFIINSHNSYDDARIAIRYRF